MELAEFVSEVEKTGYLTIIAEEHEGNPKDDCLIVRNSQFKGDYKVLVDTIYKHDWNNLKRVLDGGDNEIIYQMSRIVGYFSKISNWNASKKGELADRHRVSEHYADIGGKSEGNIDNNSNIQQK